MVSTKVYTIDIRAGDAGPDKPSTAADRGGRILSWHSFRRLRPHRRSRARQTTLSEAYSRSPIRPSAALASSLSGSLCDGSVSSNSTTGSFSLRGAGGASGSTFSSALSTSSGSWPWSEMRLGQVALQVLPTDVVESAVDRALELREVVLGDVCAHAIAARTPDPWSIMECSAVKRR